MIDVNVNLSHWPTRRLPYDATPQLVQKLKDAGIAQAWVGSFDGLLHKDIAGVNARLVEACVNSGGEFLLPFGSVNPTLPDWREDVRRCAEELEMPGIRLHPNYHGYSLDQPVFAELLDLAGKYGLIVQIAIKMEDERTQHHLLRVDPVDTSSLVGLLTKRPGLRVVLLNSLRTLRGDAISQLAAVGRVYFEISMQEGVGGLTTLLEHCPLDRILFGSHFPFFYLESALLKLRESELAQLQIDTITRTNAAQLLSPAS
ncbi:MAG: amidohydrolase family protein [Planctomycetaceae bacterium]|nr:amidohydrolase family protein [Planctomycetales bacterium]MCB9923545.1 amidohydrolase family protein [Planctomycetaceae bacterium]